MTNYPETISSVRVLAPLVQKQYSHGIIETRIQIYGKGRNKPKRKKLLWNKADMESIVEYLEPCNWKQLAEDPASFDSGLHVPVSKDSEPLQGCDTVLNLTGKQNACTHT